ncbi:hypothetical protein TRAPUB_13233 [Trametes pubescens]|uniref:Uncharacterized protein n=1 Tax=Trametes pubescens TaxID=154538 RepID=A0A1M2VRR1_TRAPU|nr:hypothetical protein TRAPUB_13233 [Trametes pubescens]
MTISPSAPTPTAASTSAPTSTSTPFTDMAFSHPSANDPSASSPLPTSSGFPVTTSMSSAAPSHLSDHIVTPALAGAVASVALTTAVAAALVRIWVRRRRPRARPAQDTAEPAWMPPACARGRQKLGCPEAGDDAVLVEGGASTRSLGSGSSREARDGSAATLDRTPSGLSRSPTRERVHVECKDCQAARRELPERAASIYEAPSADRPDGFPAHWQRSVPEEEDAPEPAPEMEDVQGERLLHLALSWVLGQRVLAFIAREDTRSVESGGSEPLPAYEPRE